MDIDDAQENRVTPVLKTPLATAVEVSFIVSDIPDTSRERKNGGMDDVASVVSVDSIGEDQQMQHLVPLSSSATTTKMKKTLSFMNTCHDIDTFMEMVVNLDE